MPSRTESKPDLVLATDFGQLYRGDCLDLIASMESESVDLVFADLLST